MATPQPAANSSLRSSRRSFRRILHPDMTPMVGLGFLLVTFFLLAADFKKPTVLDLTVPVKPRRTDYGLCNWRSDNVVSLILGKNSEVYYYEGWNYGDVPPKLNVTDLSATGLRKYLLDKKQQNRYNVILIKPGDDAKYKDMVDVLDEMNITEQSLYAMVDLTQEDYDLLKRNGL